MATKRDIVQAIADRLGVPAPAMSSGSTEPKRIFELIVEELGLDIDAESLTKPDLAHAICDVADVQWSVVEYESSGGTVTKPGLQCVLNAVGSLMGDG